MMRDVGDEWKEECNRCKCTESGRPVCTKKLCVDASPLSEQGSGCTEKEGTKRKEGEEWNKEEPERDSECVCNKGFILCTKILKPIKKPLGLGDLGIPENEENWPLKESVNFPGSENSADEEQPTHPDDGVPSLLKEQPTHPD